MKLYVLGCGSATPSLKHMPSSQAIEHNGRLYMIDCGEGAQLGMRKAGLKFTRLKSIFISHLHGDHALGMPGLLSTLTLHDFNGELHVYMMQKGIDTVKMCLDTFAHAPQYTLVFHPIEMEHKVIYEDEALTVETFPMPHTTPAVGFIFREKARPRTLRAEMLEFYNVPIRERQALKDGADFVDAAGNVIENKWLTLDPPPARSYAYASDTMKSQAVARAVARVDTLYHEATYGDDKASVARERGHSTARQ
ncbi:MAG: MBL fold metallo-hydrolase, partial [Clostridium sp.]|nr:MBL fold metallo-hydrolase [Clostridium sp.]